MARWGLDGGKRHMATGGSSGKSVQHMAGAQLRMPSITIGDGSVSAITAVMPALVIPGRRAAS